jgi:outer membrane protein
MRLKLIFSLAALLTLSAAAMAQQPAAVAGAPTQPFLPKGKVALVNTAAFQEKVGEFRSKIEALNKQFESRVKEVQQLADKINALETTLKSQGQVLAAARVAEMTEQIESMKKDYQRKSEDLQADAGRARDKALGPLTEKLGKFAEEYTSKRGIVLLVDLANAMQSGTLVWYDQRADVTQDFIDQYNKANPVPTSAPAAPPAKPK